MAQKEQMEFFHEIFDASLPRLGPGDDASTLRALKQLPLPKGVSGPSRLRVLDIGCGNGPQTLELAKHIDGDILAVDNHQPFLDELNRRAKALGLSEKIQTRLMDMSELSRRDGIFDLIWSEGALNLMGFADGVLNPNGFHEGLVLCHDLLAPGGLMAVSELGWFRSDPPEECRRFFAEAYPSMATVDASLSAIKSCGFEIINHFNLPESAWWDQYCRPLGERLQLLRGRYSADSGKLGFIESIQEEINIYRQHSSYYGLTFYLMRSC